MSTNRDTRQTSFFSIAAWLSLLVPFAAVGVVLALNSLSGHTNLLPPPSRQFVGNLNGSALLVDLGSFVLGLLSLIGIRQHGAAFILWKAVPGILGSGIFGFFHFMIMMMSSIIC
jgi:hypothetical protein